MNWHLLCITHNHIYCNYFVSLLCHFRISSDDNTNDLNVQSIRRGLATLQWRHNGCDGISIHQPPDCLLNRLFRCRSKKTSKLRITGLCAGNSPITGEFPSQWASNAEDVSIWWRHHGIEAYSYCAILHCWTLYVFVSVPIGSYPIVIHSYTLFWIPGPRLNIKTVLSTYGDFHVKDKTAVRTSYL